MSEMIGEMWAAVMTIENSPLSQREVSNRAGLYREDGFHDSRRKWRVQGSAVPRAMLQIAARNFKKSGNDGSGE
jgi:hypothetical protein